MQEGVKPLFPYIALSPRPNDPKPEGENEGWKIMYESLALGGTKGGKSTLLRALDMVEELKERKAKMTEAFAMGINLVNGKPNIAKIEAMRTRLKEFELPVTRSPPKVGGLTAKSA